MRTEGGNRKKSGEKIRNEIDRGDLKSNTVKFHDMVVTLSIILVKRDYTR